jgi:transcription initiation factor TFIID subunit 7
MVKLKFKLTGDEPVDGDASGPPSASLQAASTLPQAAAPETPTESAPRITFKLKPTQNDDAAATSTEAPTTAGAAAPAPPKQKRAYNRKPKPAVTEGGVEASVPTAPVRGRKRKADGAGGTPAKKVKTPGQQKISLKISQPGAQPLSGKGSTLMLKLGNKIAVKKTPSMLKLKHKPDMKEVQQRAHGLGYDSEDEEAEIDPRIESQFILRMAPGDDCEYLRRAIEDKKIGLPLSDGGADVMMVFLERDGRRGMLTIKGVRYVFVLVDLPCVIEATKSWNRKDWMKSADIHQMLLVTGRVENDEEARKAPLPPEVDQETYQYPHGLTPPMRWVRKRRFRKRISHRTIEAVEQEVERLLDLDADIKNHGGKTAIEMVDLHANEEEEEEEEIPLDELQQEDETAEYEELEEGQQDGLFDIDPEELEGDQDVDATLDEVMADGEDAEGEEDDEDDDDVDLDAAIAALGPTAPIVEANGDVLVPLSAVETPSVATGTSDAEQEGANEEEEYDEDDDDDEGDEDGDEEEEEEETEQQIEAKREREEALETLREAETEFKRAQDVYDKQANVILKKRQQAKVDSLKKDIEVLKAKLGMED